MCPSIVKRITTVPATTASTTRGIRRRRSSRTGGRRRCGGVTTTLKKEASTDASLGFPPSLTTATNVSSKTVTTATVTRGIRQRRSSRTGRRCRCGGVTTKSKKETSTDASLGFPPSLNNCYNRASEHGDLHDDARDSATAGQSCTWELAPLRAGG
ncbi:hypothetical protein B0H34DRAFT_79625 [Crassisporium funariophilum]|nr:hypothetical protein B0H34DRAFT_79625 [Crassisporium funariophilum]